MSKSIIKPEDNFEIEVNYRNLLLSKKVGIRAKAAYLLPFKGLVNRIDLSGYCLIEAIQRNHSKRSAEILCRM